jgi:DNA-binding transcriptional regulator YiaG
VLALRQRLEMTQYEFSMLVNTSQFYITHWETGRTVPTGPTRRLLQLLEHGGPSLACLVAQLGDPDEEALQ